MANDLFDTWFGDDALEAGGDDRFDRRRFADQMAKAMERVRRHSRSSVMSLVGQWGSGKTSVLALLNEALVSHDNGRGTGWLIADFNPWIFAGTDSLQVGFFAELKRVLGEAGWRDGEKALAQLARVAAPLGAAGSLIGINLEDPLSEVGKALDKRSASKAKERAEKALGAQDRPLLMVVDDLDRLSADELMRLFKLVRLVARLPNVYYLLCYDEQTLLDMIEKTDLVSESTPRRAVEYLEKIVQVRFDLPVMRDYQIQQVIDEALTYFVDERHVDLDEQSMRRLRSLIDDALITRLATPRAVRRYLAQIDAFLDEVLVEVNFVDYLAMTWIRTFEPGAYMWMQGRKDELLGLNGPSSVRVKPEAPAEQNARWRRELTHRRVSDDDLDTVLFVLGRMFPAADRVARSDNDTSKWTPPARGVGNPDYFDRYFNFGVPAEDLADSVANSAIVSIAAERRNADVATLEAALVSDTARTIRKLLDIFVLGAPGPDKILAWMADQYVSLPAEAPSVWGNWSQFAFLGGNVMSLIAPEELVILVPTIATNPRRLQFVSSAVESIRTDHTGSVEAVAEAEHRAALLLPVMLKLYETEFRRLQNISPLDIEWDSWSLIWAWSATDFAGIKAFFAEQVVSRRWSALELMAALLPASLNSNKSNTPGWLTGWEPTQVEPFVDLAVAASEAGDLIDKAKEPQAFHRAPATKHNRLGMALAVLKIIQANGSTSTAMP